jgi:hypothetical protein
MRSNAGMANRQGVADLREAQVSAPQLELWLGFAPTIPHTSACEDENDRFRNVGIYKPDAGELP